MVAAAECQSIHLEERANVPAPLPREVAEQRDIVVPRSAIVCAADPVQRELLQKSLESDGIRVLIADSPEDVVTKAEAERVPLLLLEGAAERVNKAAWMLRSSKNEAIRSPRSSSSPTPMRLRPTASRPARPTFCRSRCGLSTSGRAPARG